MNRVLTAIFREAELHFAEEKTRLTRYVISPDEWEELVGDETLLPYLNGAPAKVLNRGQVQCITIATNRGKLDILRAPV